MSESCCSNQIFLSLQRTNEPGSVSLGSCDLVSFKISFFFFFCVFFVCFFVKLFTLCAQCSFTRPVCVIGLLGVSPNLIGFPCVLFPN